MVRTTFRILTVATLLVLFAPAAHARTAGRSIWGVGRDATGGALPGETLVPARITEGIVVI